MLGLVKRVVRLRMRLRDGGVQVVLAGGAEVRRVRRRQVLLRELVRRHRRVRLVVQLVIEMLLGDQLVVLLDVVLHGGGADQLVVIGGLRLVRLVLVLLKYLMLLVMVLIVAVTVGLEQVVVARQVWVQAVQTVQTVQAVQVCEAVRVHRVAVGQILTGQAVQLRELIVRLLMRKLLCVLLAQQGLRLAAWTVLVVRMLFHVYCT